MSEWIVPPEDAGKKLIAFLTQHLGGTYSARYLKRILENNQCQINGRTERFASVLLNQGDHVILNLIALPKRTLSTNQIELSRVLYEDADLLIYDKPAGINSDERGILRILQSYYSPLYLVHRLDRDTTGVLLLAKNERVLKKLIEEFREQKVYKSYMAIVDGIIEKKGGIIDNYLGKKHVYQGQTIWGEVTKKSGLHAHTEWRKLKEGKQATLVQCFPKTGRTHQIRVHMASMGHPIIGDFQYCKKFRSSYRSLRILLHANEMVVVHPMTGKKMEVVSPLPLDFKQAQQKLNL